MPAASSRFTAVLGHRSVCAIIRVCVFAERLAAPQLLLAHLETGAAQGGSGSSSNKRQQKVLPRH